MQRKAMVFAAGLGTRLRPLTDDRPKALVEVCGVPMLEHVLLRLKNTGFTDITINAHHFAEKIREYVAGRGQLLDLTLHISDESGLLLDTGGGILHAERWLCGSEPVLVHNADILTDLDLDAFYRAHLQAPADTLASVLVKQRDTQRQFLFDPDMRLMGWSNLATGELRPDGLSPTEAQRMTPLAFGGIHVLSPDIFAHLHRYADFNGPVFSITPFYLALCRHTRIQGYVQPTPYLWFDAGKPATLAEAEAAFATPKTPAEP